jgi:hypothetical protein
VAKVPPPFSRNFVPFRVPPVTRDCYIYRQCLHASQVSLPISKSRFGFSRRIRQSKRTRHTKKRKQATLKHDIEEILGIKPAALTANEAGYLIGFRSADEIRDRLTKARKETDLRLRAKGIEREGGGNADGD